MKRKIESIHLINGEIFEPQCKTDKKVDTPVWGGSRKGYITECTIKHIGRQIYLIGYYDDGNGWQKYEIFDWKQPLINKYKLVFPNMIKQIIYKTEK
jgi:hypothetical protein